MGRGTDRVRGVFFDLYGTLLIYGDMQAAWEEWLTAVRARLVDSGLQINRTSLAAACDGLFARPAPEPRGDGLTLFERRLRGIGDELGIELDADICRAMAAESVEAWQRHVTLDPEARPLLESLKPRMRLGVVTNFDHPPHVHLLLERWELTGFFDVVSISGAIGVCKPEAAIFEHALKATGLLPGEVLHVGDSQDDIDGARAAGIGPVRITRDGRRKAAIALDFRAEPGAGCEPLNDDEDPGPDDGVPTIRRLADLGDLL